MLFRSPCDLKCDSNKLNDKYWDAKKTTYKKIIKEDLNYNTFNDDLAKYEISLIKNRIKDLYRFKHVYMYNEILEEIKKSFLIHQAELFEEYFLDQALEDMMPKSENDFNNYKDTLYDKYNRSGYLIFVDKYIYHSFRLKMFIYKITVVPIGKVYIGLDTKPEYKKSRWKTHCKESITDPKGKLHKAIHQYGPDNCVYEVIDTEFHSISQLALAEIKYIRQYD